ncbi:MAG: hypothetical protein IJ501_06320 [Bacilli bacterium]|nr:hypothetical protein [Bacilli bacterium]
MNRKTVLFLINGFGVEKKESYSIYDSTLMPTFEELSKKYLFETNAIESKVTTLFDAYRNASLDVSELYNYSILDKDIENKTYFNNPTLIKLKQDFELKKGNLHIFCLVDTSLKIVNHLKETLKNLNPNKDKKVYLHLVISSNNIHEYKSLVDVFSHINMELAEYAPIGFILGLSSIDNTAKQVDINFFFRMFISKVGEKWQSFTQKFDVLYATKAMPRNTKPFIVNSSFSLTKDDTFLFYNYDNLNLENFIQTLRNISFGTEQNNFSYYSLFKITSKIDIPYMYEITTSSNSLVSNLEHINATSLILCKKEEIPVINYFCNGLKNQASETLKFVDFTNYQNNPNQIVSIINQFDNDLIIINYELEEAKNTKELKEKLKTIDQVLKAVYDNMNGSKYTLIVTSLYGMSKVMLNEKENICQVIFSGNVPFMYIDDFITKKDYLVAPGNINDIFKTVYKTIKKDSKYNSIVDKKNLLYKIFVK